MEIYQAKVPIITLTVPETRKIRGIKASLKQLPRVPSIGESFVVDAVDRRRRYFIKVIDIVYKLRIACNGEDTGTCEEVQIIGECTNWQEIDQETEEDQEDDGLVSADQAQVQHLVLGWKERRDNPTAPVLGLDHNSN